MNFDGGNSLRKARDQRLMRELRLKQAARKYDAWIASSGMSPALASFYAPPQVKAGRGLIERDRKAAIQREVRARKEELQQRFSV